MEWINLAMALLGGGLVKLLDVLLGFRSAAKKNDLTEVELYNNIASEIREELRSDMASMRGEIKSMQEDLQSWKDKYYDLLEQYAKEKATNVGFRNDIKRLTAQLNELNELKTIVEALELRLGKPIQEIHPNEL